MTIKTITGKIKKVIDNATITVDVIYPVKHPLYLKVLKKHKKYICHYENTKVNPGDEVVIAECRPISKSKTWRLVKVVE